MKRSLLLAAVFGVASTAALASSHREAPMIAGMPRLDGTDFYLFNSYEPGRSGFVTIIADYIPFEVPYGGPNFYAMDHTGYYDINIDNRGLGKPSFSFRFRFQSTTANLSLNVGGQTVAIPLINDAPVSPGNTAGQNVFETYTVSLVTGPGANAKEVLLSDASGRTVFPKPLDNIGDVSIPDYPTYASTFTYALNIPGCSAPARVFVGQRKDPFVIDLGETFDLLNYAHPVGQQYNNSAKDDLAVNNVTSLIMEVAASCLTNGSDPVIGGWTTSDTGIPNGKGVMQYKEVSRLGNPLVNELVIGLKDKDTWNSSVPLNDGQFLNYVEYPTIPAIIQSIFGTPAPTAFPRTDLVAVFLTGLAGINQPAHLVNASEEERLNTSIPATPRAQQNNLGVIAGDNAGYPNGRRPGDDVVDITLQVAMGKLYTLGLFGKPGDAPSGNLYFTDGAYTDATHYLPAFPYARPPLSDSPQPIHEPKSTASN